MIYSAINSVIWKNNKTLRKCQYRRHTHTRYISHIFSLPVCVCFFVRNSLRSTKSLTAIENVNSYWQPCVLLSSSAAAISQALVRPVLGRHKATQSTLSPLVSSILVLSLFEHGDYRWSNSIFDRVNAEWAIEMRQLKGPVFTISLFSTEKHLGCIFNEEWEWVYSKRRDWKLWKRVSLFRSNRSPCFSLDVEFGFLALWLCGTVSDRESGIHRLRVSSLVPESPHFLFPSCQSVEIKMKCLAW